jgi:hypothetical protein
MPAFIDSQNPATKSVASNGLGPAGSFKFRKHWKENGITSDLVDVKPIDFWYGKLFFGRIGPTGDVIYPSETNLKQITGDRGETHWALDFVADAYVELRDHLKKAIKRGLVNPEGFITKIAPSRSWVSASKDYHLYMESVYDHLVTYWFQREGRNHRIFNFSDFVREFFDLVDSSYGTMHFTKSGHILSRYFSPLSSGLIIELAGAPHGEDIIKEDQWVKDPNFSFYRNSAKNHGFLIDKNAPWRLVADVNSAAMKKYMEPYGITGETLFDTYYYSCHRYDIESLKVYLIEMYNSYVAAYPQVKQTKTKMKGSGGVRTVSRLVNRPIVTIEGVNKLFPPEYWLRSYYYIRLREMQAPYNTVEFNKELKKIYTMYKFVDFDKALDYINDKIKNLKVP